MNLLQVDIKEAGYYDYKKAVKNIRFSLEKGKIVGLIGPNGAGKSTIIKSIVKIIPHFIGTIEFYNRPPRFTYIPEQPIFYDELTLWEHLEVAAAAYELDEKLFFADSEKLLASFQLTKHKHQFPGTFSKGMQQKAMLIMSLLIKPDIYIIDEPFVGLDPRAVLRFLQILNLEKTRGAGILISTHQLDTAERVCDSIILISEGQIAIEGSLTEIQTACNLTGASLFDCFNALLEQ
ncbi:MAG: ABC transporter ATP-binding protein [Bacillota bacterium]